MFLVLVYADNGVVKEGNLEMMFLEAEVKPEKKKVVKERIIPIENKRAEEKKKPAKKKRKEILHFKNKLEKVLFYALLPVLVLAVIAFIWVQIIMEQISPGYIVRGLIFTLIIVACMVFDPVSVLSVWLVISAIQQGASLYVIVMLIGLCTYVNTISIRYGVFGLWMLFR